MDSNDNAMSSNREFTEWNRRYRELVEHSRQLGFATWDQRYHELLGFSRRHGHVKVPLKYKVNPPLRNWVDKQRKDLKQGNLSEDRKARLKLIGFQVVLRTGPWEERYLELVEYSRQHGNTNVKERYDLNPQLGRWVSRQRVYYNKGTLSEDRTTRLHEIGFQFEGHNGSSKGSLEVAKAGALPQNPPQPLVAANPSSQSTTCHPPDTHPSNGSAYSALLSSGRSASICQTRTMLPLQRAKRGTHVEVGVPDPDAHHMVPPLLKPPIAGEGTAATKHDEYAFTSFLKLSAAQTRVLVMDEKVRVLEKLRQFKKAGESIHA